jgi:hypothetical protein
MCHGIITDDHRRTLLYLLYLHTTPSAVGSHGKSLLPRILRTRSETCVIPFPEEPDPGRAHPMKVIDSADRRHCTPEFVFPAAQRSPGFYSCPVCMSRSFLRSTRLLAKCRCNGNDTRQCHLCTQRWDGTARERWTIMTTAELSVMDVVVWSCS